MNRQFETQAIKLHLTCDEPGVTAIQLLHSASALSINQIKQAMQKGAVWQGQGETIKRLRRGKAPLKVGTELYLYYNETILREVAASPQLIADEGDYSIWYKPFGVRSQGSKWGDHCAINRLVEATIKPQRPCFIVHRLDRAAQGLIIIPHAKATARIFAELFRLRKIKKCYQAVVTGKLSETTQTIEQAIDNKPAVSHFTGVGYNEEHDISAVQVEIETGRKHQIRRHLADAGFPIVGDRLYNSTRQDKVNLQLLAYHLSFQLENTENVHSYTLAPEQQLFSRLGDDLQFLNFDGAG